MLFSISLLTSLFNQTALIISMSIISISMAMAVSTSEPHAAKPVSLIVTETAKCFSCGFTEECTPSYILRIRDRYEGRWLCGLCMEAVKDEVERSEKVISVEEAVERHISFCLKFRDPNFHEEETTTEHPISAMGRLLRRSIDSPRRTPTTSLPVDYRRY